MAAGWLWAAHGSRSSRIISKPMDLSRFRKRSNPIWAAWKGSLAKSGMNKILKSYFYWTYPRGNVHYDVMVSLILIFIFVAPHFWDFGDKPSKASGPAHPITVV